MTNPNVPEKENESQESIQKGKSESVNELLKTAVVSELQNVSQVIDPIQYSNIKYPDIYTNVRDKMKHLRNNSEVDYSLITDAQIREISDAKIVERIESYARPLKNARRALFRGIRQTFPNIRDKVPGFDESILNQKIENLDENEVARLYHNSRTLAQFLSDYFYVSKTSLQFKDYDFKYIFGTDSLKNKAPDLFSRTESAAIAYKNHGISPSPGLIRELIGFYSTTNKEKKREIFEYFDVTITLPDAIKSGFLKEKDVEVIAESEFSHVWNTIDVDSRDALIRIMRYDDNYNIELAIFDIDDIDKHFSSSKTKDLLARAINDKTSKNQPTKSMTGGITRDLEAEIGDDGLPRIHGSFLKKIQDNITGKDSLPKIANILSLISGSVLIFQDEAEKTRYFRLDETDASIGEYDHGVVISDITGKDEGTIGTVKSKDSIDYDSFYRFLSRIDSGRVVTNTELQSIQTTDKNTEGIGQDHIRGSDKILNISETEDVMTFDGFMREINLIDPDGEKIGLEKGVNFVSKGTLENGETYEGVWKVQSINPPSISFGNRKFTETVSFSDFLEAVKKQSFRRIAKVDSMDDMLHALEAFGVDHHAEFKGENLVTKIHTHDKHGHEKEVEGKYEFFQSKSGGHIRINGFSDGLVSFGEYVAPQSLADIQKVGNAGKLTKKQKNGLYSNQTVSSGEFLDYLKKNEMKATTENLLVPNATDTYHSHDPHFENDFGSLMSKVGSWWSLADMMKGLSNLGHGIEHYFEKSSKLNASRFALSMGRKMNLPLDIMAQLQADEVSGVKEIIEKIQEKFRNLNGPIARNKALHVAHNANARPEEVAASILYMVKGYGHLYAEDIAYAQGSESFINGLLTSCGFHGQALTDMKKKARDKSKVLLGNEAGSDLSEEEMIWGFMKMMDGNYDKYPVAATLVKAMGGPSGFENAWRKDGFDGAYEKGIRQAGDLVNAEARVDHGLSALSTHEFHTAIGSMEKAADKDPSPGIQTLPVVWALGGYSKYLSTKANQKIKGYADGKGHSLHAFSFLRTREDNELFRYTFRKALESIAPEECANMDKWIKDLEYDGHTKERADKIKPAINGLAGLWRKYHARGLHDALQGKNMWLIENAQKDETVNKYFKKLSDVHQNNGGDEAHSDDNGWYIQHGYSQSPILKAVDIDGMTLNSMERTLRKIKLDSHQLRMDKNHKERYWDPAVTIIKNLSRGSQDEVVKKAQFLQYRRDILSRFNEAFSSRSEKAADLKKQEYYTDLLDMGIDISVIFEPGGNIKKKLEKNADKDYQAWKNGGYQGGNATATEVQDVKKTINSVISPRLDTGYQGVYNTRNSKDPRYNADELGSGFSPSNDLGDSSGAD